MFILAKFVEENVSIDMNLYQIFWDWILKQFSGEIESIDRVRKIQRHGHESTIISNNSNCLFLTRDCNLVTKKMLAFRISSAIVTSLDS
ncbi:unnamed protein product [Lactuca virosa]|uniref:Uncharacterized protein n=1 Tax=Lactuca virosa TaxID=75947 RepID=A0AAU9NEE3_9ASTR|nr:unnamed protein product [Lactuca virosa]